MGQSAPPLHKQGALTGPVLSSEVLSAAGGSGVLCDRAANPGLSPVPGAVRGSAAATTTWPFGGSQGFDQRS